MKFRAMTGMVAVATTWAVLAVGPSPAAAAGTCTWGGTPDAPTGVTTNSPGITNLPAPGPMEFWATGALAGDCSGKLTFIGEMDAGSTCGLISFHGTAKGLPSVVRFAGVSALGLAPARLYDKDGDVVGSENAQFLTGAPVTDCNTPEGFTGGKFSSVIELFD
jgi:hypothetical protein